MKQSMATAFLILATVTLGGCTQAVNCSGGVYRSGCAAGPEIPVQPVAAPLTPAASVPASVSPAPVSPAQVSAPAVPYGDPAKFADVDDKQCRSYGLVFGTRDYADCRLRLSAQHRGLDPNTGATGSGIR
jgi:hypothetical protein